MKSKRLFVGLSLSAETRASLTAALENVKDDFLNDLRPENWHFTLSFLGNVESEIEKELREALSRARLPEVFEFQIEGFGAFPSPKRATTLWAGVGAGFENLNALAEIVLSATETAGIPREKRPFKAHLTLKRFSRPRDLSALVEATRFKAVAARADRIVLFESRPGEKGSDYVPLETYPLRFS